MASSVVFRTSLRAARRDIVTSRTAVPTSTVFRQFSRRPALLAKDVDRDAHQEATTKAAPGASGSQEGEHARTAKGTKIAYPEEHELPKSHLAQGRGGQHFKRTLASFSLEGKTAVVTGGARGLGLVMAQGLMESGANVALVDLNHEEAKSAATGLLKEFEKENEDGSEKPKITAHRCDVSDPKSVEAALSDIISEHGKIDNLVTSAGFTENFDAIDYPLDRVNKLWGVNVNGTWLWANAVARHLMDRQSPGSIVFIGSMSGAIVNVPQPQTPYNASKAAVRHLAASLAVEWAEKGIRVNCISPGYMLTSLTRKILDENPALKKKWTSLIPVGKMGSPEDLMGAVTFLASDASLYVNGADLRVDGGYTLT